MVDRVAAWLSLVVVQSMLKSCHACEKPAVDHRPQAPPNRHSPQHTATRKAASPPLLNPSWAPPPPVLRSQCTRALHTPHSLLHLFSHLSNADPSHKQLGVIRQYATTRAAARMPGGTCRYKAIPARQPATDTSASTSFPWGFSVCHKATCIS